VQRVEKNLSKRIAMANSIKPTNRTVVPVLVSLTGYGPNKFVCSDPETNMVDASAAFKLVLGDEAGRKAFQTVLTKLSTRVDFMEGVVNLSQFHRVRWAGRSGRESIVAPMHIVLHALLMNNSSKTKHMRVALVTEHNDTLEQLATAHAEVDAANGRIVQLQTSLVALESNDSMEQLNRVRAQLAQLQHAELAAEDAMCFAQLEQLFRRVNVPIHTREQLAALYLGKYTEVRTHFAGKVSVTRAQMAAWLADHPIGKRFWLRLASLCGLPVAPFDGTLYEIEHIQNGAWGGADHFFNFMVLFGSVNNSVEFRTGPCHLKMITLGRKQFEYVQRFARWHAETKPTVARSAFSDVDDSLATASLLGGPQQTSMLAFCGQKRKVS